MRLRGGMGGLAYAAALVVIGVSVPSHVFGQAAHHPRPQAAAAIPDPATPPVITLERTGCHNQCAEYRLAFYDDGEVIYDGKANVSKAGRWKAALSKQAVTDLLAEFQRIGYGSLSDKYPSGITETSTATTSLRTGDKVKTVTHEVGSPFPPATLVALEDRIDASVQSVEWSK
jgi:hypothetical protein